jgi:hypothetical protein
VRTARRLGRLAGFPAAGAALDETARLRAQVSAADVSPNGRTLAVLSYGGLLLYPRTEEATWGQAVRQQPARRDVPWLHQPEAMGWAADGRGLFATGEFSPAPLVYLPYQR